jgi:hypothetical protein
MLDGRRACPGLREGLDWGGVVVNAPARHTERHLIPTEEEESPLMPAALYVVELPPVFLARGG